MDGRVLRMENTPPPSPTLEELLTRYCRARALEVPVLVPWEGDALRIHYDKVSGKADIHVPLAMLDLPPDRLAWRIHGELIERHILSHIYPIDRPAMPELTEALEQLCMMNGILHPPALLATTSPFCSAIALVNYNAIILGDDVLSMRPEQRLAVIAHELGHFLNPGLEGKESERAADAAAVRLMGGSRAVVAAFRRSESTQRYVELLTAAQGDESAAMRVALYRHEKEKLSAERYGTQEERVAHIRVQDPHDRSHLERLIAERDARLQVQGRG